ncbi:MAG: hypothetical protein JXB38_02465 [Anaerolineales bacterium]|nr:hypothetical protein [Anaerolineales bacterium]
MRVGREAVGILPFERMVGAGAMRLPGRTVWGRGLPLGALAITCLGRVAGRTVGRGFGAICWARARAALRFTVRAAARWVLAPRRTEAGWVRRVGTLARRATGRDAAGRRAAGRWTALGARRTPVF